MDNYSDFFIDFAKNCSKTQKKSFKKSEIITTYIAKRNQFCLLLSGEANLIRYDFNGNRTIVEHFSTGAIFGEIFYTVNTNNELFVEAKKNSTVMFFSYDNVENKCDTNCTFHNKLIQTLPSLFLNQIIELNMRIELLSKRTIREKLLAYFTIISTRNISKSFTIPFSLTDLADYLSIDRSAMMRELGILKSDGIIEKSGNRITLLY
ncbi:MAG: Crp/Fnr family transcriptional regulator [Clostridia bacterium]|jgi:CRP-like cAMP-binding protein|nr:cyclic nucleotide-binding domain protein [Clostridium sp. CAG:571]HJJ07141.1 Crp/Fnr family transcriptional regulator [Clostridiaceae bacterium]HJJ13341.1 Crp/Fnr family transcriptional regulator [Clostridiaceae bacterium]